MSLKDYRKKLENYIYNTSHRFIGYGEMQDYRNAEKCLVKIIVSQIRVRTRSYSINKRVKIYEDR